MGFLSLLVHMFGMTTAHAIPLELKPVAGLTVEIYLNLPVNGQSRKFILDTGSDSTVLARDRQSSAMKKLGAVKVSGVNGSSQRCDLVGVDRIDIDKTPFEKIALQRCPGPLSLLGMDLLAGTKLALKFSSAELTQIEALPEGAAPAAMSKSQNGNILLPLTVEGLPSMTGMFDTGWAITAVDVRLIKAHPQIFVPVATKNRGIDVNGRPFALQFYRVKQLKVGGLELRDQIVEAHAFPSDPNFSAGGSVQAVIGASTIQQGDWFFDLAADQWTVVGQTKP